MRRAKLDMQRLAHASNIKTLAILSANTFDTRMPAPLISIITINRNNAEGLARTLTSTAAQFFSDFEHIVVDGASTDGSVECIRRFETGVTRWVSEPDRGIYNAMNKAIAMASGKYLVFLNSGDHFLNPNSLTLAAAQLQNFDLHYFALEIHTPRLNNVDNVLTYICPERLSFSFLGRSSLPHPATFIKADLFQRYGKYDESLRICADWKAFLLWVCKYNCTYKAHKMVLSVFYADGVSSLSSAAALIAQERREVISTEFPAFVDDLQVMLTATTDLPALKLLRSSRRIKLSQRLGVLWRF